jgi:DUF177 domain-containing protein
MVSPHRPLDRRSGLVIDTQTLGRRAGAMKVIQTSVDAPAGLGIAVIGVTPGSPIELDLRLESVVEGVLVTGTAQVAVSGECVRCLTEISDEMEIDIQELFVYPDSEADEDEASRLEGDLIDLEPLLRDEVVLELPFQPLCREDCAGLCVECGANLNVDPEHTHDLAVDPRWEKLRDLEGAGLNYDGARTNQDETPKDV